MLPILLGRVSEHIGVEKKDAGKEDVPVGDGKTLPQKREDAPDDDEAKHDDEADELREMKREIAEVDVYKLEIKCVAGVVLEFVALLSLLDLCCKIFATSPKFIESYDFWPEAPMLSLNAPNMLCVETGRVDGSIGNTLGIVLAGARL